MVVLVVLMLVVCELVLVVVLGLMSLIAITYCQSIVESVDARLTAIVMLPDAMAKQNTKVATQGAHARPGR